MRMHSQLSSQETHLPLLYYIWQLDIIISIVLVARKAFSPTRSKPELQKHGRVVLKSMSACVATPTGNVTGSPIFTDTSTSQIHMGGPNGVHIRGVPLYTQSVYKPRTSQIQLLAVHIRMRANTVAVGIP